MAANRLKRGVSGALGTDTAHHSCTANGTHWNVAVDHIFDQWRQTQELPWQNTSFFYEALSPAFLLSVEVTLPQRMLNKALYIHHFCVRQKHLAEINCWDVWQQRTAHQSKFYPLMCLREKKSLFISLWKISKISLQNVHKHLGMDQHPVSTCCGYSSEVSVKSKKSL